MGTFLFPLTSYPGNLPNILTSDLLQPNLQESRHVYGTCTSVELPGTGRTTPVDKRIVIRSDRYLIVRVIINIDVIREDRRNVKRVKPMQHRQLGTLKKTVDHSEGRAPMPRCPRIRVLPRIFLRYHAPFILPVSAPRATHPHREMSWTWLPPQRRPKRSQTSRERGRCRRLID